MAQQRAKAGGETGVNGLYYNGGEFLPSTQLLKTTKTAKRNGTGKREVAPYKWEVAPVEMDNPIALYSLLAGSWMTRDNKPFVPFCNSQNVNPANVQTLIDRYLTGKKWIEASEVAEILK